MDLSIVIPAYSEAHKIARDIQAASQFLVDNGINGEIIVADDGSPDGTADAAERAACPPQVAVSALRLPHRGKGFAVREGMKASRGDFVMFADSGVCVPFTDALEPLKMLKMGECDIADGSRKMAGSQIDRAQPLRRRILSRLFRSYSHWYLGLPRNLTDTQCGFKLYRGDVARTIYAACVTDGFMFDLEVLMRARAAGLRIVEFPVHWACDPDSRLKPSRILGQTLAELRILKRAIAAERAGG
jgi:glycosyltransferase involved in cell wall biosynthesis